MARGSDQDLQRILTRRALVLGGAQLVLAGVLGVRLHYLQITEGARYRTLSEKNQFNVELLPAARGRIFDRQGRPLATNRENFRIIVIAEQTGDLAATLQRLHRLIPLPEYEIERIMHDASEKRGFVPIQVVENLTREDIARVAVQTPSLPGIRLETGHSRHYPFAASAVHVTGYVAPVWPSEQTGDPTLELPGFRIGKSGIEKSYDIDMRGESGRRQIEVNAVGRTIRKLPGVAGAPGRDVILTVDAELQEQVSIRLERGQSRPIPADSREARRALSAVRAPDLGVAGTRGLVNLDHTGAVAVPESGAAIVMDIYRGDILALASTPGFDPNAFNKGLTPRDWDRVLANPRSPMSNKAIAGRYAPGSTFKPMVCLAALADGVAPDERVYCPGHMELGDGLFHCWNRHGHGWVDMFDALEQSCDVYFYEMAKRLDIDRIAEMARRFGFGEELGIELPGERNGLVPSEEWKLANTGEGWQEGETVISAIGQGYLLATPLQMVTMMARLANRGRAVVPNLTRDPSESGGRFRNLGIPYEHLSIVMEGLHRAVNGRRATGGVLRSPRYGFEIAGKTGSVQVRRITREERLRGTVANEDRPWHERDHALFVGVAPADQPLYAAAVVVEHGGSGGRMAAPIAGDILAETIRHNFGGHPPTVPLPVISRRDGRPT